MSAQGPYWINPIALAKNRRNVYTVRGAMTANATIQKTALIGLRRWNSLHGSRHEK